ncbi:hypothetical protein HHI36_013224 [Cryptolaemus montrouzieri]|uniref:Uncharacterized protein n=1 Tax=Cryptolaemus montrouzieri TaxID=559131 RepID=A0ABD2NGT8_9CUCU
MQYHSRNIRSKGRIFSNNSTNEKYRKAVFVSGVLQFCDEFLKVSRDGIFKDQAENSDNDGHSDSEVLALTTPSSRLTRNIESPSSSTGRVNDESPSVVDNRLELENENS